MRHAPLIRDLRQLLQDPTRPPTSRAQLAKAAGIDRETLGRILEGTVAPTPDEVLALCREKGVVEPGRFLALGMRYENTSVACRYRQLDGFDELQAFADAYPNERAGILRLADPDPDHPLAHHTATFTFDHDDAPDLDPKGELWEGGLLLAEARRSQKRGRLEEGPDPSRIYQHSFHTLDEPPYRPAGDREKEHRNVTIQMGPEPWRVDANPDMRCCRFHAADVYLPGSPVGALFETFVGDAENVRSSRRDLNIDYANDLLTCDLVPTRLKDRRQYDDVLVARYGSDREPRFVLYDNARRGGGMRFEFRDRTGAPPGEFAFKPNPCTDLVLWDLDHRDVMDRDLLAAFVRAQERGARYLQKNLPKSVWEKLIVQNDPNHPARIFDQHYERELRRLAKHLRVEPSYFGLANDPDPGSGWRHGF